MFANSLSNAALATRYNLAFNVGEAYFFIIPHNAILHRHAFQFAIVADGHVGPDGAVLDGDIFADNARRDESYIVNGLPLVYGDPAHIV